MFIVWLGMLLIFYWYVFPYKTFVFNGDLETTKKVYKQGDILVYKFNHCQLIDKEVQVDKKFIDGVIYSIPTSYANHHTGCKVLVITMKVPHIPTGTYRL